MKNKYSDFLIRGNISIGNCGLWQIGDEIYNNDVYNFE